MGRLPALTVVLGVVCVGLLGIATNVATAALPAEWEPYLWIAWPALLALLGVVAWLEVRRSRSDGGRPGGGKPAGHNPTARGVLIDRVQRYWVHGVLEQSLYQEARIELGLQLTIDAPHPWRVVMAQPGHEARTVQPGTAMAQVFDELDKTMLIRGAPGAGKTTMLLELVRDLLHRAREDEKHPIPIVLTLSSWARRREPLGDWIVRELADRYEIPPAHARTWLESDQLTPLLDGLDEVAREHQEVCVDAINAFRAARGTTRVVVCCRSEDYQRLKRSLRTYGTLTIQPLSREQVNSFLATAGEAMAAVRAALAADPTLWEIVESPLNLSIMVLAYRGAPVGAIETGGTQAEQRERLFATYLRTMLARRQDDRYPPRQTVRRLAYLAGQLGNRDQTVFTFDQLDEFSAPQLRDRVILLAGAAVAVLAAGLLGGIGQLTHGRPGAAAGVLAGVLIGMGAGAELYERIGTYEISWRQRSPRVGSTRLSGLGEWTDMAFGAELARDHRRRLATAVAVGVGAGALFGRGGGLPTMVAFGLGAAVAVFVASVMCNGLSWPIASLTPRESDRELPSPRALAVVRGGLVASTAVAAAAGIVPALLVGWRLGVDAGAAYGGFVALAAGTLALVSLGGYAVAEQVVLRLTLRTLGLLPLPARPFLHYATQCLFLRRVGDAYLFAHLSLQEYFESMWPNVYMTDDLVDAKVPDL